ncbi:STAS domain-containing protein [Gordonia insulae]|uniref:STAS domain-containing protein n=1 Tax=Gordonia insulae TaxID=2420509 RepID=UPI0013DDE5E0|nr:STAS domain-containing protein [Gordonia insulae]
MIPSSSARRTTGQLTASKTFCVQQFSGEIDMANAADFAAALDRVAGRHPECVVLDLLHVTFMSAAGLAILDRFCADAADSHIPVAVACDRSVARPVEACGLDGTIALFDSVTAASAKLSATTMT